MKERLTIINILLVVSVLIFLFYGKLPGHLNSNTRPDKAADAAAIMEELKQVKDESSGLLSEVRVKEVTIERQQQLIDSLRKALPRELRPGKSQVRAMEKYRITADTVFSQVPVLRDSTFVTIIKQDPWLTAKAVINTDTTASIDFKFQDTLHRVEIVRKHLFKPDERIIILKSSSPYSQIRHGYSIAIKERRPIVSFGPSVSYDPFANRISAGISVQFPFVIIKKR